MRPLIIASIVLFVIPSVAIGLIAVMLSRRGFAPGWTARCAVCGNVIPAGEIPGVVRVHTHRSFKSTANHLCDRCGETRTFQIEYGNKD